jgi:hypothetical protein
MPFAQAYNILALRWAVALPPAEYCFCESRNFTGRVVILLT